MARTRRGVDRQGKQSLFAQTGNLRKAMDTHMRDCHQCHNARGDIYDHCTAWWQLAVDLHKLKRRLRVYDTPETAGHAMLPGMDTL